MNTLERYGVALVVVVVGVVGWTLHQRSLGAAKARSVALAHTVKALTSQRDSLAVMAAQKAVVFARDTIRLRSIVQRVDSLHDSVLVRLTDTVRVKEFIAVQDTALRVCRETVTSCTVLQGTLRQLALTERARADSALKGWQNEKTLRPRWYLPALGVGIAAGVTTEQKVAVLAGLTFGWRF